MLVDDIRHEGNTSYIIGAENPFLYIEGLVGCFFITFCRHLNHSMRTLIQISLGSGQRPVKFCSVKMIWMRLCRYTECLVISVRFSIQCTLLPVLRSGCASQELAVFYTEIGLSCLVGCSLLERMPWQRLIRLHWRLQNFWERIIWPKMLLARKWRSSYPTIDHDGLDSPDSQ